MRFPTPGIAFRTQAFTTTVMLAKYFAQGSATALINNLASAGWPAANRAIFMPFELEQPMIVTRAWLFNGASANTGNWDVGLYTADGTRLVNMGSMLQSGGINSLQQFDLSDTLLGRGVFYFAVACNSVSTTVYRVAAGAAQDWLLWGGLQQDSAFALPATATFASNQTAFFPLGGFTGRLL
jgi:hypothetical protein